MEKTVKGILAADLVITVGLFFGIALSTERWDLGTIPLVIGIIIAIATIVVAIIYK